MKEARITTAYKIYDNADELPVNDRVLLDIARKSVDSSYAPYSGYHVGAAVKLADGTIVTGSNQENAAFPASLCAERVAIFAAGSMHPGVPIEAIAITARADRFRVETPVPPCGMCRQAIVEYETLQQTPIRLILGGENGEVFLLDSMESLLPLMFSEKKLQKP